jgi:hypothetical protein
MNYQELYTQIIDKLKKNERPLILLTPELIAELKAEWQKAKNRSKKFSVS